MTRKATCFILMLWFPLAAAATEKLVLSLDDAVRIGIENSPALHASRMELGAAEARVKEIESARHPSFKLGGGYARLSEVPPFELDLPVPPEIPFPSKIVVSPAYFNNFSLRLSVEQTLFAGFRLQAGQKAAGFLVESVEQDAARDRDEFVFAVKSSYWDLAMATAFESVIGDSIEQIKAHLADVRAFFEQGLLTNNEVLRIEVQLANAEFMKIEAGTSMKIAASRLSGLIGLPLESEFDLATTAESLAAEIPVPRGDGSSSVSESFRSFLSNRPDLMSAQFRIKASEEDVIAARAGWYPQIQLSGNVYWLRPNPRLLPAEDKFYGTWDLGISLSFDIWNWGRTKWQTRQAEARLAQARDARELLEDRAVLEAVHSEWALEQAREKIAVSGRAVGLAEENLRVAGEKFRQGVALSVDVLDAEVALLQAKLNRTRAAIELALAQARLQKALGR